MKLERGGLARFGVEFHGETTAVLEKFDARERGAEFDPEMAPVTASL